MAIVAASDLTVSSIDSSAVGNGTGGGNIGLFAPGTVNVNSINTSGFSGAIGGNIDLVSSAANVVVSGLTADSAAQNAMGARLSLVAYGSVTAGGATSISGRGETGASGAVVSVSSVTTGITVSGKIDLSASDGISAGNGGFLTKYGLISQVRAVAQDAPNPQCR